MVIQPLCIASSSTEAPQAKSKSRVALAEGRSLRSTLPKLSTFLDQLPLLLGVRNASPIIRLSPYYYTLLDALYNFSFISNSIESDC